MKINQLLPKTIFLLFFTSFIGFGQNIKGTIIEKDSQKPLENVNVFVVKKMLLELLQMSMATLT